MRLFRDYECDQRQAHADEDYLMIMDFTRRRGHHEFVQGVVVRSHGWSFYCSCGQLKLLPSFRSAERAWTPASTWECNSEIYSRLSGLGDGLKWIASAFFRDDPFLFVADYFQQQLFIFVAGQELAELLLVFFVF